MSKVHHPNIQYLTPSPHGHVLVDEPTCQAFMRLTRCRTDPVHGHAVTYGQYFEGITDVISKDDYALLVNATARQLAEHISLTDIEEIMIYAEKHGSDYHPARIDVVLDDRCASFVMNLAVTERGRAWLCREFEVLQYLNTKYDFPFLPRTYFQAEAFFPSMLMFLADWFKGYHEFHLSKQDGSQELVLWGSEKKRCHLSRPQAWQIYHQAAKILTLYYDVETFEQIFPWHHAAGDFVVKQEEKSVDIRLVTARQYAPMLERSEGVSVIEGLLFFLLNLSIRMRLDRLDGVGAVAWADNECVDATLEGFVEALRTKENQGVVEKGILGRFVQHVMSLSEEDLSYRFHSIIDAWDQAAPDIPVITGHFERHISKVCSALQIMIDSPT